MRRLSSDRGLQRVDLATQIVDLGSVVVIRGFQFGAQAFEAVPYLKRLQS